jgi:hypothetical protein
MCANDMIQVGYSAVHIPSLHVKHILFKYNIGVSKRYSIVRYYVNIYSYFMICSQETYKLLIGSTLSLNHLLIMKFQYIVGKTPSHPRILS